MPSGRFHHPSELRDLPPRRLDPGRRPGACAFGAANARRVAFDAFRTRYAGIYLRYARVRLHSVEAADLTVRAALENLAARWHIVLREASPTAACWSLITSYIAARAQMPLLGEQLTPEQTDMLVLRYRVGLSVADAAAVMGMDVPEFTVRLGGAIRLLTSRTTPPPSASPASWASPASRVPLSVGDEPRGERGKRR
ncbi:hypothetical protein ACGFW5_27485 [Streptomyces sp. NPDC048416]|uniref:hypothetical protein n=1 Tax=Streptomyces sp. NPDC048416 TaxID=3365546 RepID=UPI003721F3AD